MIIIINIYLIFNLLINIIVYVINKNSEENLDILLYLKSANRTNIMVLTFFAVMLSIISLTWTIILIVEIFLLLIFYVIIIFKIRILNKSQK